MEYRNAKTALVTLLGEQANGRFRVIGYQRQSKGADELTHFNRLVQVYYTDGDFPKSKGRRTGSKTHDASFDIDMSASAPAQCDTNILDDPNSTPQQKAATLLAVREAAEMADISLDETIDAVWNILNDARNQGLGLPIGDIASRWTPKIQKDTTLERGDLVVRTGKIQYTCTLQETCLGDIGVIPATSIIDTEIPVNDTPGAGVITEN